MLVNTVKCLSAIFTGAVLCACATPYQSSGFRGGYKDAHIRDNLYYVEFSGNAWIDTTTSVQFFHRRAKEVCIENGYADYRISQQKDITGYMGVVNETSATMMQKPGFSGYVECLN